MTPPAHDPHAPVDDEAVDRAIADLRERGAERMSRAVTVLSAAAGIVGDLERHHLDVHWVDVDLDPDGETVAVWVSEVPSERRSALAPVDRDPLDRASDALAAYVPTRVVRPLADVAIFELPHPGAGLRLRVWRT